MMDAEDRVLELLQKYTLKSKCALAGNSVGEVFFVSFIYFTDC